MKRVLPWLRIAAALAVLTAAVLLCWQCVDIYAKGNAPENLDENGLYIQAVYRADDVGARLKKLALPLGICAAAVIAAAVVQTSVPDAKEKHTLTAENRLRLMKARAGEMPPEAVKEARLRRSLRIGAAALIILCAAPAAVWLLDKRNFASQDLERVMGSMLCAVGPWVLAGLAVHFIASELCSRSMERECETLRGAKGAAQQPSAPAPKAFPLTAVRVTIFAAAAAFIVLGVMNGGLRDVLIKAINICTECIGLG